MDIFKDKVLVILCQSKPTGILIISSEIADHFKRYFDSLWAYCTIVVMLIVMTIHAEMGGIMNALVLPLLSLELAIVSVVVTFQSHDDS
jgi:hypothetical protein